MKSAPALRSALAAVVALLAFPAGIALAAAPADARPAPPPAAQASSRAVDVVIVLDTSGSMDALLDATRARVWDVVNELGRMKPTPLLRVGLISFGTDKTRAEEGFIIQHLDLTGELDAVYAELMALTIGGSTELVGRALAQALDGMSWSREWDGLRLIFVAGNESADQGVEDDDFRVVAQAARDKDVIVNALYAGDREQGVAEGWPAVAQSGRGNFSAIDPVLGSIQIATPYDTELLALNARLNATYVPYGERGQDGLANQVAQDGNASSLGVQSCSSRIVAKGGALYNNASWDLVDKALEEGFDWNSATLGELPADLERMTVTQRTGFIEAKRAERERIQLAIQETSQSREAFVKAALAEQLGSQGLGEAMRMTIRAQALAKGFTCDGC